MPSVDDRLVRLTVALLPEVIVTIGVAGSLLPRELIVRAISALSGWLLLSIPIGVLFGHCVLDETG